MQITKEYSNLAKLYLRNIGYATLARVISVDSKMMS
jgi:hypothetical protein